MSDPHPQRVDYLKLGWAMFAAFVVVPILACTVAFQWLDHWWQMLALAILSFQAFASFLRDAADALEDA